MAETSLGAKEASQLLPYQKWWTWRLRDSDLMVTDLCRDVQQTRVVSTLVAALLPSAQVLDPDTPGTTLLQDIEMTLNALLSNGVVLSGPDSHSSPSNKAAAIHELATGIACGNPRSVISLTWMLVVRFEVHRRDPTRRAAFLRQRRRKVQSDATVIPHHPIPCHPFSVSSP